MLSYLDSWSHICSTKNCHLSGVNAISSKFSCVIYSYYSINVRSWPVHGWFSFSSLRANTPSANSGHRRRHFDLRVDGRDWE